MPSIYNNAFKIPSNSFTKKFKEDEKYKKFKDSLKEKEYKDILEDPFYAEDWEDDGLSDPETMEDVEKLEVRPEYKNAWHLYNEQRMAPFYYFSAVRSDGKNIPFS